MNLKLNKNIYIISILVVALSLTQTIFAWSWALTPMRYQKLNTFQRAQYDKAKKLFEQKQYLAASSEFEKMKIQFPDSPLLPYFIFMNGYCQHQEKNRHKAIKIYNKVLDYFGDSIEDASSALYYLGVAHFDNGDEKEGMLAMKEMAEDEDYQKHPLAAGALRLLATNYWENKEEKTAIKYLKQVVKQFSKTNQSESDKAREKITRWYIQNRNYSELSSWMKENKIVSPNTRHKRGRRKVKSTESKSASYVWNRAYYGFIPEKYSRINPWDYTKFNQKQKEEDMKDFWNYFKKQKNKFEKDGDEALWDYYSKSVSFLSQRYENSKELKTVITNAVAYVKKMTDNDKKNKNFGFLADKLSYGGKFEQAKYLINFITDDTLVLWKQYYLLGSGQDKWKEATEKLEEIEKTGDGGNQTKAKKTRASVYQTQLHWYEKAIKLYLDIAEPPKTLWSIQYCYYKMGDIKKTIGVLNELEASFPKESSKAAWQKAEYYQKGKQTKSAIKEARRIMKLYPKSPASSKAHQLLEDYGIATGGGLIE